MTDPSKPADPRWETIRPDRVQSELARRDAFRGVSSMCNPRITNLLVLLCSAFLHDKLSITITQERLERLRPRKLRYRKHAEDARSAGDFEDAQRAQEEAAHIETAISSLEVGSCISWNEQGEITRIYEDFYIPSPREMELAPGPASQLAEAQNRGRFTFDLASALVAYEMREPEVLRRAVPPIQKALQSAYPGLLNGGFGEADRKLSRYLRESATVVISDKGKSRSDLLIKNGRWLLARPTRTFSAAPEWQDSIPPTAQTSREVQASDKVT